MTIILTPEQEDALALAGPRVAIAAGAGSGKTTLLCEAIWRDVEDGGIPIDGIFVATYNRAAAAHLIAKLQERFAEGRGPERVGLDLSAAWVGTFHSLCDRLVRERPFDAGVDPDFHALDEIEAGALADQALNEALESVEHEGLALLLARVVSLDNVTTALLGAHDRLRAAGMEKPRISVPEPSTVDADDAARLRALLAEIADHTGARDVHREQAAVAITFLDGAMPEKCPAINRNCKKDLRPLANEACDELARHWQARIDVEAHPQLEGFAELLAEFSTRYAELKQERGALDYEDLLFAAHRLLQSGSGEEFRRVYVDEFQDANAIQNDIIDALGAERTVIVGDSKQAIYGFRHADPAHFRARIASSADAGLNDNHRSAALVLDGLNALLDRVLDDAEEFVPLVARAAPSSKLPAPDPVPVECVSATSADGESTTREQEAQALVQLIHERQERGYALGNIVVLFRALTQVGAYTRALDEAGIANHLVLGRDFFVHEQVADALAVLALVENPRDEAALLRALASPFIGVSDRELVAIRREAGPRAPLTDARDASGPFDSLLTTVEHLRAGLRSAGLAGTVRAIVSTHGYDLAALASAEGERRYANLRKLVRLAASFEAVRGPELRGFLNWIEIQEERGIDPGEATLIDPDRDAVSLATIHAVKGQEFPVVILADASHRTPGETRMVLTDREGNAGIAVRLPGADNTPALGLQERRAAEKVATEAEERRLLYVALTRAQHHAVVLDRGGNGAMHSAFVRSAVEQLDEPERALVAEREITADAVPTADRLPEPDAPPVTTGEAPPPPARTEADPTRGRRISFSALSSLSTCARRFHLEYELGLSGDDATPIANGAATGIWPGTAFGTIVHEHLETINWTAPATAGWAATAADRAGLPPSPTDATRAEAQVRRLIQGPIGERVRAGRADSECSFAVVIDGVVLSGAVDLVLGEPDGRAVVYDWKTHRLEDRDSAEHHDAYRLQMALYGLAVVRSGAPSAELNWVFLDDPDQPLVREVDASDTPELEGEIRDAMASLADRARAAARETPGPICTGCPGLRFGCPVSTARG